MDVRAPITARSHNRRRLATALLLAGVLALASTGGVAAGRRDAVDPAFLTPALNPDFAWECWRAGDKIICEGHATVSYEAEEVFPCSDGGAIYLTGTDTRTIRRVSDSEGRAVSSLLFVTARDRASRSPDFDGIVAYGRGQFSVSFDWPVPGDLESRTSVLRGMDLSVTIPGQGLVLHQVGVISYDFHDNLLFARGVHPIVDDPEAAFEQLCLALAGD